MNLKFYQHFFDHAIFPVFAADTSGVLVYKNGSAGKYLPMLRKNASVKRHFQPEGLPEQSGAVRIARGNIYRTALALCDEDGILFLCLSRFQKEDGEAIIHRLLELYGTEPLDFIRMLQLDISHIRDESAFSDSRTYSDMLTVLSLQEDIASSAVVPARDIAEMLFPKLIHAFRALGYRITATIDEDFDEQSIVRFSVQDFLFLFGLLLYLQMRLSENKTVAIRLQNANNACAFRFSCRTEKPNEINQSKPATLFMAAAPECEAEILLLEKLGFLDENIRILYDKDGMLHFDHLLPRIEESSTLRVCSLDTFAELFADKINIFIDITEKRLKEIGASC